MINKRKIVLASLLKPVNDPRMFEKFALSMSQTNKYDINIIGFSAKNIPLHPDIHFHPIFKFKRLSLKRLIAPLKYWQKLVEVKPELIVVNSHDLLSVSCAYKILFGCKIIYDIQENYQANIIWSSNLPWGVRQLIAGAVRTKEQLLKRMIIHFFLAEKCYVNECSFINSPFTILENKALFPLEKLHHPVSAIAPQKAVRNESATRLLYSGTIAESYGIFDCLELVDNWVADGADIHFTIIGYCPRKDTLDRLQQLISGKPYINLIGGNEIIPHSSILSALRESHFALVSYRLNPSNQHCMPTRIWECLAYKTPMIMKKEHPWTSLLDKYKAGTAMDFHHPPRFQDLLNLRSSFYPHPLPDTIYWNYEAEKLLNSLESLF